MTNETTKHAAGFFIYRTNGQLIVSQFTYSGISIELKTENSENKTETNIWSRVKVV